VLRARYYAQASAKNGKDLLSSSASRILNCLPPELRRFETKGAAAAAAVAFQQYLNNPTRKAARQDTHVAATPEQGCPCATPATQKRPHTE
jgi:hypothetical protein